jgi:hypothetical protein
VREAGRQEVRRSTEALHLNRKTPAPTRRGFTLASTAHHQSWGLISAVQWFTLWCDMQGGLDQSWKRIVKITTWAAFILLAVLSAITILQHKLAWLCLVPEYCK